MLATYTPNPRLEKRLPVFMHVGISIHKSLASHFEKTKPSFSK